MGLLSIESIPDVGDGLYTLVSNACSRVGQRSVLPKVHFSPKPDLFGRLVHMSASQALMLPRPVPGGRVWRLLHRHGFGS